MSSDEQIPAVAEVENAKLSDGTSTAGEVNVDKVNEDERVPESNEKEDTETEEKAAVNETVEENKVASTDDDDDNEEKNLNNSTNKRDIDQVEEHGETSNGHKDAGDEADEAVVTTTSNKKAKILHPSGDEDEGNATAENDQEDNSSNTAKVPNEELTVV